ncbi:MAG: esterase/lipase family protein [Baekduiaceae bacterium]
MSRLCAAMITAVLAFLATPAAQAAEDPVIPLLTGGQLTYSGQVQANHDWMYHGVGYVEAFEGYEAEQHRTASLDFATTWLVEGRYPDVPPAKPQTELLYSEDYKTDVGSGSSNSRQRVYHLGAQVQSHDRTCTFGITLDDKPMGAPVDETGRTLELDPVTSREETERSGCAIEGTADLFTSWSTPLVQQYTFAPELPRATSVTKPLVLNNRKPAGHCDQAAIEVEQCDYAISGQGKMELTCALCVDDIVYEHGEVPGYAWKKIGEKGTFDGNRVKITAKVRNATKRAITAPVALRDMTHKKALTVEGLPATITVAPGQTIEVPVEWDSSGYAWEDGPKQATLEHEIAFLTPYGSAQKLLRVRPKPVIMVHGWNSDASTWSPYPGFLKAHSDSWVSHAVGSMNTDPEGTNSIFQNADALARELRLVRESEDADKVDIVAHSMGGLISRAYIDRTMGTARDGKPQVAHLIQLGTPNMGSPCADVIYHLWSGRPTLELTPGYVQQTFNPAVRNRKGVPFSVMAGIILDRTCHEKGLGDGVVSLPSAKWEIADNATRLIAHTSMSGSQAAFEEFVAPRIEVGPGGAPRSVPRSSSKLRSASASASAAAKAPTVPQVIGGEKLTLGARKSTTVKLSMERGASLTAVVAAETDVLSELVSPRGKVVASVKPGSDGALGLVRTLRANDRRGGKWTVRLKGGAKASKVAVSATVTGSKIKLTGSAKRAKTGKVVVIGGIPGFQVAIRRRHHFARLAKVVITR